MQTGCPNCRSLASTRYPCKKCQTNATMMHTHDCGQEHWFSNLTAEQRKRMNVPPPKNGHYTDECPNMHIHPFENEHDHSETGSMLIVVDPTTPEQSRAERMAFILSIPWISPVKGKHVPCSGKVGDSRRSCKNAAKFRYKGRRGGFAQTGVYCWSHLPYDMDEEARLARWLKRIERRAARDGNATTG